MTTKTEVDKAEEDRKHRIRAAAFLGIVGGGSALFGFSKTLSKAKRQDSKLLEKGGRETLILMDEGSALALRALGYGTTYAVLGCGLFCFGIWKLSGAKDMTEFRSKMGSFLPKLTSNSPATSRTEFEGLSDLMRYLSTWRTES
ncbi:TMEM242 family protein [Megaselia abdita]